eukprot:CAMPEP_0175109634 /NCGR_PEP_ID=MMETSP0086_2-20121207/13501_1 /TAXON_ID=136419 /ORGANISM="Unknown Unknown, Strain D1" /LENGTH=34 /DNA_ID= /DNA_START= /DNA_END= /DNA_ORIENTATION=
MILRAAKVPTTTLIRNICKDSMSTQWACGPEDRK